VSEVCKSRKIANFVNPSAVVKATSTDTIVYAFYIVTVQTVETENNTSYRRNYNHNYGLLIQQIL